MHFFEIPMTVYKVTVYFPSNFNSCLVFKGCEGIGPNRKKDDSCDVALATGFYRYRELFIYRRRSTPFLCLGFFPVDERE